MRKFNKSSTMPGNADNKAIPIYSSSLIPNTAYGPEQPRQQLRSLNLTRTSGLNEIKKGNASKREGDFPLLDRK
ncbi:hypothetical protein NQ315_004149 [Exocentrus adspersus]|uniref:Uncharacterized protein n=1 Tax=Exocentrus adspersus TaxID=1586481 RepID=A0AAV8W7A6_9CUCU|nr:hypothetical protein NQ315_004149 [Exocentrus adspersus]